VIPTGPRATEARARDRGDPGATLGRPMTARVHRDPSSFERLARRWREVLERDPAATVFHTPQYLATWWQAFGGSRELLVVEVSDGAGPGGMEDGAAPRGMAALTLDADGVLRFAGDHDTTDYRGPTSAPADREAVAAALVDAVAAWPWRVLEADGLAGDSGWAEALAAAAKAAGHEVVERVSEACPRVALDGGFDAYLAALPGKLRHEILRKARRLEREAGPAAVRLATEATLDDDLERFFGLHRTSRGPKGRFMHEGMATFFGSFAWMLHSQGWLRLALLEVDGEPWAGVYGFRYGGTWGVWNSAYDHARSALAPGVVLLAECIRLAAEEGCRTFDFLRGTEPYKYRFGAVDVPLLRLEIRRV
jgi:CelD/BcsL family acetyltransferase involved in cellulose biosynthesis